MSIDELFTYHPPTQTQIPKYEEIRTAAKRFAQIPHTVLYGQSPAGLRATGDYDTRQYYDSISRKQENDLRPQLDYLDQVLIRSALGEMPPDYSFDFKPLWQIDEVTQSNIRKNNAQRDEESAAVREYRRVRAYKCGERGEGNT